MLNDTAQNTERQAVIDDLNITIEALPANSNPCMDDSQEMDHWSIKLTKKAPIKPGEEHSRPNYPSMSLVFSQGIGHRRLKRFTRSKFDGNPSKAQEWDLDTPYPFNIRTLYDEEQAAKFKPVPPSLIDVLHCLTSDSDCADYTFEEWCDNLGYDTDSRKAERMFKARCNQTVLFKRLIGDDFEALQTAMQDY